MELVRGKEVVHQYHFDRRNPAWEKKKGEPKTKLKVNFQLVEHKKEEQATNIIAFLNFMVVVEGYVISGSISQQTVIKNRIVNSPQELTDEEKRTLSLPLLDMLKRLSYEVTEIAFDKPGIKLEF